MRRPIFRLFIYLILSLGLLTGLVQAQSGYPQAADKYVNDYADVISAVDETALYTLLADFEGQTGVEAVVLTVRSVGEYRTGDGTIESFATNLFNAWGIGNAERNDGLLVLVAVDDRQVRLEVGRGYGHEFDAIMQRVIDEEMLPRFREERYSQGIYEGTRAAAEALSGGAFEPPARTFWQTAALAGLTLLRYWWLVLLGVIGFFGVVVPFGRRTAYRIRAQIPPSCVECGRLMSRIAPEDVHNHYTDAQRMEVKLGSVTYSGWKCVECGHVDLTPKVVLPVKYTVCPECSHRTVGKYVSVKPAKPGKKGRKRETFTCHNCDYFHEETSEISYNRAASSSYRSTSGSSYSSDYDSNSSSSYNSGSDSFGGGSSSGGGASGSW